jgi:CheY-like chemotaxis protein/GAF domain-containing protein
MDPRPRLLLIGLVPESLGAVLACADVVAVATPAEAADRLRSEEFSAVVADPSQIATLIDAFRRGETVLTTTDRGIATLAPSGTITWANPTLHRWCPGLIGKPLFEALDPNPSDEQRPAVVASDEPQPLVAAAAGRPVAFRVLRPQPTEQPYLDVVIRPVVSADGSVNQLVAMMTNVTAAVEQQKKLDALHRAGRELASIDADQLAEMNVPTRIELLKKNISQHIHDLLHYDTIEIRLLDRTSGELKPLLQEGMTSSAAGRRLFARPTGNGVTGYVAFTGKSYLCPDTESDPHYIEGAAGARSSLTVPLKYNDEVVGTLNVESPRVNGFGPKDLQFTELFSKEIANALHTLDLLSAQESCTLSQSIEAVNREIALPVDEVLASAALLYARLHAADPEAAIHLRRIMGNARQVKECVQKVGRDLLAAETPQTEPPLAGKRVLVVDQDERMRKQAHLLLGRLGAEVETVSTASEGHALVADADYDAVFQEIRPADMSGYEAFRRFRIARPEARVALTTGFGYDSAHTIVKAKADGLQHILFKPFRADQVVTAVNAPPPPPPSALPITAAAGQP